MQYVNMLLVLMWVLVGVDSGVRFMGSSSILDGLLVVLSIVMVTVNLKRSDLI